MFRYRSKILIAGIIFEAVMFINILSLYLKDYKVIPISMLLVVSSILMGVISLYNYQMKYTRMCLLFSILFIPFSGVFSLMVVPVVITLFIGYIRQDKKVFEKGSDE